MDSECTVIGKFDIGFSWKKFSSSTWESAWLASVSLERNGPILTYRTGITDTNSGNTWTFYQRPVLYVGVRNSIISRLS